MGRETIRIRKKKDLTTWRDVLEYCVGEVGLRPDEFWSMTLREIEVACRGYEVRLARTLEMNRFIASILINANLKKGRKQVRPEDIMPLVTDRRQHTGVKAELMSAEEFEKIKEMFSKAEWQGTSKN